MPHIILEGPVDLGKYYADYQPSSLQAEGGILKLQNIFISRGNRTVLVEAIAVEGGLPNRFFIQAAARSGKTTVKIYPGADPEKTTGVKKLLALIAKQLKDQEPEIQYGTTNLKDFLL